MAESRRPKSELLQTGLLGLIALLILVSGLLWGQRINPFVSLQEIQVRFSNCEGIGRGDSVYLNGMVVGNVSRLELQTNGVLLTLRLPQDLPLSSDARFQIGALDLMGGHAVFIENGSGGAFQSDGEILQGEQLPGTRELLAQAQGLIINLDNLTGKLEKLLPASGEPLPLRELADDIVLLTGEARQLLVDLQSDRRQLTDRLGIIFDDSDTLLTEIRAPLLELISAGTEELAAMQLLTDEVRVMLQQPGTLQKLAADSTLYHRTLDTVNELDTLLQAIADYGLFRFHKKKDK
ncbi:MAG: MCE family protein [Candidatus Delongbacteria bacterium]|nr:MCE family protein [Candidatus Delongbacteria bacterium]